jgi:Flp pilus assembly protein TadD
MPHSLPALNGYASALSALGRHDEAANRFAQLLRLTPDNPAILNNYGRTMALAGRTQEARDALENAVRIQPMPRPVTTWASCWNRPATRRRCCRNSKKPRN